jgi:heat shock protein HtpX
MFIVNPLRGGGLMKLFSTHPPIEERIKRLNLIASGRA